MSNPMLSREERQRQRAAARHAACDDCNELLREAEERAEKAERERDEAKGAFDQGYQMTKAMGERIAALEKERDEHKLNEEMAVSILHEIGLFLETCPCCHDKHGSMKDTPPMMYPEWIVCVMAKQQQRISALEGEQT